MQAASKRSTAWKLNNRHDPNKKEFLSHRFQQERTKQVLNSWKSNQTEKYLTSVEVIWYVIL